MFYSRDIINPEDVDLEFNYVSPKVDNVFRNKIMFPNLLELMNLKVYMHQFI